MKTIELKAMLYSEDLYTSEEIHLADEKIMRLICCIDQYIAQGEIVCLDFKDFPKSYPFQSLGILAYKITTQWDYTKIVFCNITMEILDCFSSALSYVTSGKERLLCNVNNK